MEKIKIVQRIISSLVIILNFYFIPYTIITLIGQGGPMGYGLLIVPITISINFLMLPAIASLTSRFQKSRPFLMINSLGLVWSLFWFIFFLIAKR